MTCESTFVVSYINVLPVIQCVRQTLQWPPTQALAAFVVLRQVAGNLGQPQFGHTCIAERCTPRRSSFLAGSARARSAPPPRAAWVFARLRRAGGRGRAWRLAACSVPPSPFWLRLPWLCLVFSE